MVQIMSVKRFLEWSFTAGGTTQLSRPLDGRGGRPSAGGMARLGRTPMATLRGSSLSAELPSSVKIDAQRARAQALKSFRWIAHMV